MTSNNRDRVMRFRITLSDIEPPIWRMIDVPESYSFWDLHVAIQDAMGWLDYHLHSFMSQESSNTLEGSIGIPDEEFNNRTLPGWEIPISRYFVQAGDRLGYEYDFGDGWYHRIELVDIRPREPGRKYPHCVDGARACPPEDCGGIPGYYRLLEVLADSSHEDHDSMVRWLKGHAKNYYPYEPDAFDPTSVRFDDPERRFKMKRAVFTTPAYSVVE